MTLRLFDTAARTVREFRPVTHGKVSVYLCGATVQGAPHLGHLRSAVCFDVLVRWLEASGQQVTYCRNVTDIDDKILRAAAAEEIPWWALAERYHSGIRQRLRAAWLPTADVEPRATGHIPDMIALIGKLVRRGHAYLTGGDVYFDVNSDPDYGTLSRQPPSGQWAVLAEAEAANPLAEKRDPRDFVVWKGAKPGEPAWQAPWGRGRPGWHIECSAMAVGYLGSTFDIHGGGQDLIFPHHENERAQSRVAGDEFARYWVHHGLVTVVDTKMSKSLGNALAAADALVRVRPQECATTSPSPTTARRSSTQARGSRTPPPPTSGSSGSSPGRSTQSAPPPPRLNCGAGAADLVHRRARRRPQRALRARRGARHSAGRQLRSKQG